MLNNSPYHIRNIAETPSLSSRCLNSQGLTASQDEKAQERIEIKIAKENKLQSFQLQSRDDDGITKRDTACKQCGK